MTMNKAKYRAIAILSFLLMVLIVVAARNAAASNPRYQDQDQDQKQHQDQEQSVTINVETPGGQLETLGATTTTVNDNESSSVSFNTENNSSNTVLVPNNNTESCLRVFGFGIPTSEGSVILGIPWRSGACDLEAAADDAFAQGQLALGWTFKCKQKALKKAFGGEGKCVRTALEGIGQVKTIHTLEERLTEITELRERELRQYKESRERLTEMCNDSKNRLLESCMQTK